MHPSRLGAVQIVVALLASAATLSYCIAVWYLAMFWRTLVPDLSAAGGLSRFAIQPMSVSIEFAMVHWQLPALASLFLNAGWARHRLANTEPAVALCLPLGCHLTWLCACFFLHVAGVLDSFVAVAYTLD